MSQAEEEQEQRALGKLTQDRSPQGGCQHEQVGVEMTLLQSLPGVPDDMPAARQVCR